MKQIIIGVFFMFGIACSFAQTATEPADTAWKTVFRGSATKINAIIHTKLEVKFDYGKSFMYGKEWITLKPYCYPTDSLTLDAKGMDIKEVDLVKGLSKKSLKYVYDSLELKIKLDRMYTEKENYVIYIDYTSKPDEQKTRGSAAITDSKGLYFINPKGEDKTKPTQIWTQGETEANSVWMPTIDKPNQKSTEEIYMTVPAKYVTLSNGLLISQKKNADGTRTDYWKMDLPHAPYLFFMAVGDFAIIKDKYKQKEVNYYVEKQWEPVARKIFGYTPEMIQFFSTKLAFDFPWPKYSQIVGRDFVSGAMENTTATLHQESAYQNARELTDGNIWEETISHELFHQWFGDLVTTESWSNITVNETMANYAEVLWNEYKHGKDYADEHNFDDMRIYLSSGSEAKDLVRYHYADKEDVFDRVSYNKGGRILHMLRNYVGDDAFFKSLNNYLTTNKFKTGEAAQLRLAFEEVTGKDLNWFWNQWYYGSGHPKLEISYAYSPSQKKVSVFVQQTQKGDKIFKLPIAIDIYSGKNKIRENVWIENRNDTFEFTQDNLPDLVNVDADKVLLCEKKDNKTKENLIFQFQHAPNYLDRLEALEYFDKQELPELALGLNDKFAGLRCWTIEHLIKSKKEISADVIAQIEKLATTEKDKKTKAAAIDLLAKTNDKKYESIFSKNVSDSSYTVSAAALKGLNGIYPSQSYSYAKKYSADAKGALSEAVLDILLESGNEDDADYICNAYNEATPNQEKITLTNKLCSYLEKVKDESKIKKGIDYVIKFRNLIPNHYRMYTDPLMIGALNKLGTAKGSGITDYINNGLK